MSPSTLSTEAITTFEPHSNDSVIAPKTVASVTINAEETQDTSVLIKQGSYALKRDFTAKIRLTAQHYLWKDTASYNIHPHIIFDPQNVRIADIATGNAVWLLDVSRQLPSTAKLNGFDISLELCPPEVSLPANVRLYNWDIFQDPPAEFIGAFDIVHVRLISVVVQNNDPVPIITNLYRLLKPGGYIQWDEVDAVDWNIKSDHHSANTNPLRIECQQRFGNNDWKRTLIHELDQNGFQNSVRYAVLHKPEMERFWDDLHVGAWAEFVQRVLLKNPEQSAKLASETMKQLRDESVMPSSILTWVAQKAQLRTT